MKATRTIFAFALSTLSFCGSARAAQYDFDFWAIHIFNTRSRGTDTDYAFFSIKVGTKQYDTVAKRLGNLNNGDTNIHIGFSNIDIPDPGIAVKLTWSVVNSGHGSDAQYKNAFDTTGGAVIPNISSDYASVVAAVFSTVTGLIFADCDGPVVNQSWSGTAADLSALPINPSIQRRETGGDTPHGCGSNSDYQSAINVSHH